MVAWRRAQRPGPLDGRHEPPELMIKLVDHLKGHVLVWSASIWATC